MNGIADGDELQPVFCPHESIEGDQLKFIHTGDCLTLGHNLTRLPQPQEFAGTAEEAATAALGKTVQYTMVLDQGRNRLADPYTSYSEIHVKVKGKLRKPDMPGVDPSCWEPRQYLDYYTWQPYNTWVNACDEGGPLMP
jgi:hypothetical protein